jgi:hypothetical protein
MDQKRAVVWVVCVLSITAALVTIFTRLSPTYTAVPLNDSSGIMVLNSITGEVVKFCFPGGCQEMPPDRPPRGSVASRPK